MMSANRCAIEAANRMHDFINDFLEYAVVKSPLNLNLGEVPLQPAHAP